MAFNVDKGGCLTGLSFLAILSSFIIYQSVGFSTVFIQVAIGTLLFLCFVYLFHFRRNGGIKELIIGIFMFFLLFTILALIMRLFD
jgi:hypothetical protein